MRINHRLLSIIDMLIYTLISVRAFAASQRCTYRWLPAHVRYKSSYFLFSSNQNFRTIQTAVLIETLTALGAEVTWSSCVMFESHHFKLIADAIFSRTFFLPKIMLQLRKSILLDKFQIKRKD